MKKLTTAWLTAGLLVSVSACAAPTLTTEEACERINIVVSNPTANMGKTGMIQLANQIRPIEAASAEDLKPALRAILAYADESVKDHPESEKLTELQTGYENAGITVGQVCR